MKLNDIIITTNGQSNNIIETGDNTNIVVDKVFKHFLVMFNVFFQCISSTKIEASGSHQHGQRRSTAARSGGGSSSAGSFSAAATTGTAVNGQQHQSSSSSSAGGGDQKKRHSTASKKKMRIMGCVLGSNGGGTGEEFIKELTWESWLGLPIMYRHILNREFEFIFFVNPELIMYLLTNEFLTSHKLR